MKKEKYHYNLKTLQYEKIEVKWTQRILRTLIFLIASMLTAGIFMFVLSYFYDSPKEQLLKQELEVAKVQLEYLNKEYDKVGTILEELRERDINTYRVIFEAEPYNTPLWNAGTGGTPKYEHFKQYEIGDLLADMNSKVDLMKQRLYLQSKSYDEISELILNKEDMLESIPAIQPVANKDLKRMASGYGWRIDPVYGIKKFHYGMDFTAPTGTDIYATGKGVVTQASYNRGGYGNRIFIDHGYGYVTHYAHLSGFAVEKGDSVVRGEVIGYVGNTGKSVGPHLHYEVIHNKNKVNPVYFYYQDLDEEEFEEMIRLSENTGKSFD